MLLSPRATYNRLEKNLEPYANATPINSALGDKTGIEELRLFGSDVGHSLVGASVPDAQYHGFEVVPITTIDAFVRERHLPRVDFIKMDTEGYERQVLEGAKETIRKYRPTLALSAYHQRGDEDKLKKIILEYCSKYQCRRPADDLICSVR